MAIPQTRILRIRTRLSLSSFELISCSGNYIVPLPVHFDPAAFDNFDQNEVTISGLNSTHDTAVVLFQEDEDDFIRMKPNLSEVETDTRAKTFSSIQKCQIFSNFQS